MIPRKTSVSNVDVVVLALAKLGGATKKIMSEDIAAEACRLAARGRSPENRVFDPTRRGEIDFCHRLLAPDRFSWRLSKYRDLGWPDKECVRSGLEDAAKQKHGTLVEGDYATDLSKDGWRLTPAGVRWLENNTARVVQALDLNDAKIPKKDAARFIKALRDDPLFKLFLGQGFADARMHHLTDMLNCSPDASRDIIIAKFERLQAMAALIGDPEIQTFLNACTDTFSRFLRPPNRLGQGAQL